MFRQITLKQPIKLRHRASLAVFEGRDLDVVAFDIAAAEAVDVGVPEAGEAAEEKDVPEGIQVSRAF